MSTATLSAVTRYVHRISDGHAVSDGQLLDRFALRQDGAAFAEIVRRHGPMVLTVCRRVLRHEHDAEDAFQATFLVLARKAPSVREGDALVGWLYRVAYRAALRVRTTAVRGRAVPLPDDLASPLRDPNAVALDDEVQRLPEPYRAALVLCCVEGRTQAEAARLLATTAGAVNSRLKRARELLRTRLARRGVLLSNAAIVQSLAAGAAAALPPELARRAASAALTRGVFSMIMTSKLKILSGLVFLAALVTAAAAFVPAPALGDGAPAAAAPAGRGQPKQQPAQPQPKAKRGPSVILLWMNGGPSQIDTFDPKPGEANGALFKAIDTSVKGLKFSETLPKLAKVADHLAVIRTLSHRDGDHVRAAYLMRTGRAPDGLDDYPALTCLLAKVLGDGRPDVPRHFRIDTKSPFPTPGGPGFLGGKFAAHEIVPAGTKDGLPHLRLPPGIDFEKFAKGKGEIHQKAVAKAFDLHEEKAEARKAYGSSVFGQGCLLARRLVEAGVPVIELPMGGWDTHADAGAMTQRLCDTLDPAWSALLKDLHDRKLLDTTLVVWMGEFGRTPRINAQTGRDHWPMGFSVVLAGCGIKGGQAIGKTSADGTKVDARPVTVEEFHATVYAAVGIDPASQHATPTGKKVPYVAGGAKPVKEALR